MSNGGRTGDSLFDDVVVAARRALTALVDEIDHYAAPGEVPMETRLAHDRLADALDALPGDSSDDDA